MCIPRSVAVYLSLVLAVAAVSPARADNHQVVRTMPIGGEGDWDYPTVSADGSLLFVPRTTHTQVIVVVGHTG